MAWHSGISGHALESARTVLAGRDRELAAADRELIDAMAGAHAIAIETIHRLDGIGAEIEAATAQIADSPAAAHDLARSLVTKQREMIAVISRARAEIDAKTLVLQSLTERFRLPG